MNENVKAKCDLLINNRNKLEKEFKWGEPLMNIAAALVYTGENNEIDIERLKECKQIISKNTGVLSSFRSTAEPIVASKMALSRDPSQYMTDLKMVYEKVSTGMFSDSGYLIQAAISICEADRLHDSESVITRFKELYKRMGKLHPFLTSSEDIVYAMLLTLTDKSVDAIIRDLEEGYNYLKSEKKTKVGLDAIYGLSEVLALSDGYMKEKCDKAVELYEVFKAHGVKYGTEYGGFASLGALIDIDIDKDALVEEIIEVEGYLKNAKGFGSWSMDSKQRMMFAAMLVGEVYSADSSLSSYSAINSSVAVIIAEEVALMACMCMMMTVAATTN